MEYKIIKTIEMKDTNNGALMQVINELEEEGIQTIKSEGRSFFPIESSTEAGAFVESIEDNAFELGLDHSKGVLVYCDTEHSKFIQSQKIMKLYGEMEEISDSESGISIANIPDLIELIQEKKREVEEEIEQLFPDEVSDPTNDEITDDVDGFDQDFDAIFDEILKEEESSELKDDRDVYVEENSDAVENKDMAESDLNDNKKSEVTPVEFRKEIATDDYLLEKAKIIFESEAPLTLPQFDELTNKEMQEQFISAQAEIEKARVKSINTIYQRLKEDTNESMQTIETHLLIDARKNHTRTLEVINENFKADAEKVIKDSSIEYKKEREQFIKAQIPALEKQYDALNFQNNEAVIDNLLTKLNNQKVEQINEENKKYQDYLNEIFDEGQEKMLGALEINDVLSEYNEIAEEQLNQLKTYAKGLKGQIGDTITKLLKERKSYKEQIESIRSEKEHLENQLISQSEMSEKQSQEKIKAALKQKEEAENQANKKLAQAEAESNEMLLKIKELEKALDARKEEAATQNTVVKEKLIPVNNYTLPTENFHQEEVVKADKVSYLKKVVFPYVLGTCAVASMIVGAMTLNGIKTEMSEGNDLQRTIFISQLESNKEYNKAANAMKQFGYNSDDIANMYLDNSDFNSAVEEDSDILPDVLHVIGETSENKKDDLNALKKIDNLSESQIASIDTRIDLLDKNLNDLEVASMKIENDQETINLAVSYLIQEKDFSEAETLLKDHPNKKLSKELSESKEKEQQIEKDALVKSISENEDQISGINKKNEELNKQIEILKSGNDKDKDKKVKEKEKEIENNKAKKEEMNKKLEEEKAKLEKMN
ncbi:hypothetical protein [Enterococcus mundtii]|uniref:hypothetical protein n=1 Tax=Enterococcus mundtii TaxID=53346 RepID=UPI000E010251|nr:hypothetical protein [Enterococcus mundtii]STE38124.1 Uncharacterised protein [Enterococcus mundtii]